MKGKWIQPYTALWIGIRPHLGVENLRWLLQGKLLSLSFPFLPLSSRPVRHAPWRIAKLLRKAPTEIAGIAESYLKGDLDHSDAGLPYSDIHPKAIPTPPIRCPFDPRTEGLG